MKKLRIARTEAFMVEIRCRPPPRHGTAHDSQPIPSFSEVLSTSTPISVPTRGFAYCFGSSDVQILPLRSAIVKTSLSRAETSRRRPPPTYEERLVVGAGKTGQRGVPRPGDASGSSARHREPLRSLPGVH